MRYHDAAHVDTGSFFARRPIAGHCYRMLGHAVAVAAALVPIERLPWLAPAIILLWLCAWFQVVGTLWRASLVAALIIVAVRLTLAQCCGAAS